ncbi:DUF2809 domain-containing protein [Psychrobacillus sp. MER TA 171]|uniref:ribosomal maturation YjgA family protein n=1 Tax=Psychrobacillus sp. MER TA 171 TaxID=2939577 RepID=UPI0020404D01|nr:DUF2809 domain-containing protein [Psychrobacillus sp. MER TA 171]MCM3357310.1 DUF2809 domain-containing protein [Psychrobacillus sp. MER TA 171]
MKPFIHFRITYLALTFLMIVLGLASRRYDYLLIEVVADNAGDTLWAAMVYFGARFIFVNKLPQTSFYTSLFFCFGIEFSQLYQGEWINSIRGNTLGALILGRGFLIEDLWRYTLGVVVAYLFDALWNKFLKQTTS